MKFEFTGNNLRGVDRAIQRLFEVFPGAASWTILVGMTLLAFYKPLLAAIIIIAFYFYWLLKLLYLTIFLILSYLRLSVENRTDWMERVRGVDAPGEYLERLKARHGIGGLPERVSAYVHRKEVENLLRGGGKGPLSKDIYHLVIIPVAKETREVIEPGIKGLVDGTFPPEQMIVVLALEERASDEVKRGV